MRATCFGPRILWRHALVLNAHVGERGGRDQAGEFGVVEVAGVHKGFECVQAVEVLLQQPVADRPKRLERVLAVLMLDLQKALVQRGGALGVGRDALRGEGACADAHLLGRGDDDLQHGLVSVSHEICVMAGQCLWMVPCRP